MKTEQDLATLILNRWHELGANGVKRGDRFDDRYIKEYEQQLEAIRREMAPIRACIDRR